jgi:hypothetical protein
LLGSSVTWRRKPSDQKRFSIGIEFEREARRPPAQPMAGEASAARVSSIHPVAFISSKRPRALAIIEEIAKTVGHLIVFQRTPNWCAPLHNGKISNEEMRDIPCPLFRNPGALRDDARLLYP